MASNSKDIRLPFGGNISILEPSIISFVLSSFNAHGTSPHMTRYFGYSVILTSAPHPLKTSRIFSSACFELMGRLVIVIPELIAPATISIEAPLQSPSIGRNAFDL